METNIVTNVPYLNQVLIWNETLNGLPALPLVLLGCIVIGYMAKLMPFLPNKWIPAIVFLFGIGANLGIQTPDNWMKAIIFGMVAGAAAIFLHRKFLRKWIDEEALKNDSPDTTKP